MTPSPWLTTEEATQYLRMKTKNAKVILHQWIRQGRLKAAKPSGGRSYLHKIEWLDAFQMGKR